MIRLEPGDETLVFAFLDADKANKGAHLVDVAADRLFKFAKADHVRVGRDLHEMRFGAQAEKQAVEQREARRVRVTDDRFRLVQELAWNVERGILRRIGQGSRLCEKVLRLTCRP